MGLGRRLIGWLAAYAFILHAALTGIVATQLAMRANAGGVHAFELCLTGADGGTLPAQVHHENCAIHCAAAGALPALLLAFVALLFPLRVARRSVPSFLIAPRDRLRRAGLGSRAPPLHA